MPESASLSPRAAVTWGLFVALIGGLVIAMALHIIPVDASGDAPQWVGVLAGLAFVLAGAAIIVGFAVAGGAAPDGDLPPGTPFAVRLTQYLLGLGIVGLLTVIAAWVAFGPGHREFGITGLPLVRARSGETMGRVVFGIGAVLSAIVFIALGVASARRLRRR